MSVQEQVLDSLKTDHLQDDLKGRSVRGGVVALSSQGAQFLIQSVATVVLARLLTPADFGLVAMVTAVTGLAQAFADLGLSEATIQRKEITHNQVSALFWINVVIGLGLTLITALLAPAFAWFYREPRLVEVALMLSVTFLISGLRVQPDALLKRQMRFASLAIRDVVSYAVAVPFAIIMAMRGYGYWALVAIPLSLNMVQMTLAWMMVNWRPSLPRRDPEVRSMVVFGSSVAASYLTITLNRSADNILIGWYWGAAPLGLYSRAYNLLMLPIRQLTAPASSVAIPAFSRIQDDPDRFARYYLGALGLVVWISAPIFGFLFVAAEPVIVLILGSQWREAAPVFQFLAISALGQLLLESTIWLLISRGESRRLLKLLLIVSPVIVASFVIGLPFGIKWVALSFSLVLTMSLPWILKYAFRGTSLTLARAGRALLYPVLLCFIGVCLAKASLRFIPPNHASIALVVAALSFAVAYSISIVVPSVRREIASFGKLWKQLRLSGRDAAPAT
jgi:O-antigen/teichoic acid export membrane protein